LLSRDRDAVKEVVRDPPIRICRSAAEGCRSPRPTLGRWIRCSFSTVRLIGQWTCPEVMSADGKNEPALASKRLFFLLEEACQSVTNTA
jgi:hypothetical protein